MDLSCLAGQLRTMSEQNACESVLHFNVGGCGISLRCAGFEPDPLMFASVSHLLGDHPAAVPTGTFTLLLKSLKDLQNFLPPELSGSSGRFQYSGAEGRLTFSAEFGYLSLYDAQTDETFIWLCPECTSVDSFISHPLHMELGWWAQRRGWSLLHSGCVGSKGRGVLISGAGGSGKSTLSLSALLCGMQFVSDDYTLIRPCDPPEALRLYSTGYLREDILQRLPELAEHTVWTCEERRKSLVDLGAYKDLAADVLPLTGVILPHIDHAERPSIRRNKDLRKLIPLLSSTSYQNRELRNRDVFFGMMKLLKDLPAYDFSLTDDLEHNALFLKEWMEEQ